MTEKYRMTGEHFQDWQARMSVEGLATTDKECARLLGRTDDSITSYKRRGTDRTVALACAALIRKIKPYGEK